MRRILFTGIIAFVVLYWNAAALAQSRAPSLRLKAYERLTLPGVAPSAEIKVGGEEMIVAGKPNQPAYYIYLIANKVPNIKLDRVWIKQQLYSATQVGVTSKPVLLENGKQSDTLVTYTKEAVWQIIIKDKDTSGSKPKKDMADKIASNELVIRLIDKNGTVYTRTIKTITSLKPFAGM